MSDYQREWVAKNREHVRQYQREWRERNKEYLKEQQREYYLRDKDKKAAYHVENKERQNEKDRAYYAKNRDVLRAKAAERRKHPDFREKQNTYARTRFANDPAYRAKRRADRDAREWAFTADFTYEMLVELRSQECFYCGSEGGTVDHVVPRASGGEDRLDNLVPCCRSCNARKNSRSLSEFYAMKT